MVRPLCLAAAVVLSAGLPGATATPLPPEVRNAKSDQWVGVWLNAGRPEQPCTISRRGKVYQLVNERGDAATGEASGDTMTILPGGRWTPNLKLKLSADGKSIHCPRYNSTWTRK